MQKEKDSKTVKIITRARRAFLLNYTVSAILVIIAFYLRLVKRDDTQAPIFLLIAIFVLTYTEVRVRFKKLIITNKKLTLHEGLFKKHDIKINYHDIHHVFVKQSKVQKLLGSGELYINDSKKKHNLVISKVRDPEKVKNIIDHFIRKAHKS